MRLPGNSDPVAMYTRNVVGAIGLLTATAIAAWLLFDPRAPEAFAHLEAYKSALQFIFVAMLGGGVAYCFRIFEQRREQRRADREALEDFHRQVVRFYHAAKLVRRELKASTFDNDKCERGHFEALMIRLESVQLDAEAFGKEIAARQRLFGGPNHLQSKFESVEHFLNDLLKTYEGGFSERRKLTIDAAMTLAPPIIEFMRSPNTAGNPSKTKFFEPMNEVIDSLADRVDRYAALSRSSSIISVPVAATASKPQSPPAA